MGNWIPYSVHKDTDLISADKIKVTEIPDHVLIDIIRSLNESDVAAFRSVCKHWNWVVSVIPDERLPKLHVARLGVE